MLRGQGSDGFDLDDDQAGDEEIGEVFTHHLAVVVDLDGGLGNHFQAKLPQFNDQRVLVDLLQACPELVEGNP